MSLQIINIQQNSKPILLSKNQNITQTITISIHNHCRHRNFYHEFLGKGIIFYKNTSEKTFWETSFYVLTSSNQSAIHRSAKLVSESTVVKSYQVSEAKRSHFLFFSKELSLNTTQRRK